MEAKQKTIKLPERVYDRVEELSTAYELPKSTIVDLAIRAFADSPILRESPAVYGTSGGNIAIGSTVKTQVSKKRSS